MNLIRFKRLIFFLLLIAGMTPDFNAIASEKKEVSPQLKHARSLLKLSYDLEESKVDSAILIIKIAKEIAKKEQDTTLLIKIHRQLSYLYYWGYSDYYNCRKELDTLFNKYYSRMTRTDKAFYYSRLGDVIYYDNEFVKSIELYFKALEQKTDDSILLARIHHNLGWTYSRIKYFDKAVHYAEIGVSIMKARKSDPSPNLQGLVYIYQQAKNYDRAIEKLEEAKTYYDPERGYGYYHFRKATLLQEKGDLEGAMENAALGYKEAETHPSSKLKLFNLGLLIELSLKKEEINNAFLYFREYKKIATDVGNHASISKYYYLIAEHYSRKGVLDSAMTYLKSAENLQLKFGQDEIKQTYKALSENLRNKGNIAGSLDYLRKHLHMSDSLKRIDSINADKAIDEQVRMYELENVLSEKEEAFLKKEMQLEKEKYQKYILVGVLIIVLIAIVYVFKNLQVRKRMNRELSEKNILIERHHLEVQEKNKEILDSITYAKRIQNAILPPEKIVNQYLKESFIFYKPKDIVAGDFYFFEIRDDHIIVAAADCTGHGVPGAMVSVVCSNALSRAVKEFGITEPGKILDKTTQLVLSTFERSESEVKDGMDISLISIRMDPSGLPYKPFEIKWSGANNPLWVVKGPENKGTEPIIEITGDKQPIGKHDHPKLFKTHLLEIDTGDTIYLFTDGFADQFGGPKGKKFKYRQFQELLIANSDKQMFEQKQAIETALNIWKGDLEQVDDILIIGLKV